MSHDNHHLSDSQKYDDFYSDQREWVDCGAKDKALIARVGNKLKHKSVLEQLVYWFDINGISRACLQELARHRTARLTVKSTRYTLKELKDEELLDPIGEAISDEEVVDISHKYLVDVYDDDVYYNNINQLQTLQKCLRAGMSNDKAKYLLPEAFKTRLQWQIDGRNLQNFLELRSSKDALWEIRQLAREVYTTLPADHQYLYEEYMKDN
jgi:thymidylate synthase (FAD)